MRALVVATSPLNHLLTPLCSNAEGSFAFIVPEDVAASKPGPDAARARKAADSDDAATAVAAHAKANGNGGYIQLKHLEKIRLQPQGVLVCRDISVELSATCQTVTRFVRS